MYGGVISRRFLGEEIKSQTSSWEAGIICSVCNWYTDIGLVILRAGNIHLHSLEYEGMELHAYLKCNPKRQSPSIVHGQEGQLVQELTAVAALQAVHHQVKNKQEGSLQDHRIPVSLQPVAVVRASPREMSQEQSAPHIPNVEAGID